MPPDSLVAAVRDRWTLIRNIRQLLTLHGASGPRRGAAMQDLQVIANSAVLIRDGVIEEAGSARRIENLATAKRAYEIDVAGQLVMPAFADVDVELVTPPQRPGGNAIRVISRKNALARAAVVATERARNGCLTVGATTSCSNDLRNTVKVLRTHRALQAKPLRIRSVYSHSIATPSEELTNKWLPVIRRERLGSVIELSSIETYSENERRSLRDAAVAAATEGFAIRIRSDSPLTAPALRLALSAGAISVLAPMHGLSEFLAPLSAIGCVHVVPAPHGLCHSLPEAMRVRKAIDDGAAIALTNGSFHVQMLLHLAVERLGMTLEEAIMATTYNAVCSLRLSHVTGSVEPGKSADLVVMALQDYRDLRRSTDQNDVSLVMRAAQLVSRRTPLNPD